MSCSDPLLRMVSEYDGLAAAYTRSWEYLDDPLDEPEEWLINLQNHLLWGSYQTGRDDNEDVVVLEAIVSMAQELGLRSCDITGPVRQILDELTLV